MATLDFTPLFRSTIGFDQLPSLLSHALERPEAGYPPYNIEKVGEDQYRIVMAVAGFAKDDVELFQEQNRLTIRGKLKKTNGKLTTALIWTLGKKKITLTTPATLAKVVKKKK